MRIFPLSKRKVHFFQLLTLPQKSPHRTVVLFTHFMVLSLREREGGPTCIVLWQVTKHNRLFQAKNEPNPYWIYTITTNLTTPMPCRVLLLCGSLLFRCLTKVGTESRDVRYDHWTSKRLIPEGAVLFSFSLVKFSHVTGWTERFLIVFCRHDIAFVVFSRFFQLSYEVLYIVACRFLWLYYKVYTSMSMLSVEVCGFLKKKKDLTEQTVAHFINALHTMLS